MPMTPREYLDNYPDCRRHYRPSLKAWDVIDAEILRDLWPSGDWNDREDAGRSAAKKAELSAAQLDNTKPSLMELAFQKAVEAALDDTDIEEALTSVENIPSLPDGLVRYILDKPASAGHPCGVWLLIRAIKEGLGWKHGSFLDRSPWSVLTEDEIMLSSMVSRSRTLRGSTCRTTTTSELPLARTGASRTGPLILTLALRTP